MDTAQGRVCLRCGEKFWSVSKANRICPICQPINKRISQESSARQSPAKNVHGRCVQDSKDGA